MAGATADSQARRLAAQALAEWWEDAGVTPDAPPPPPKAKTPRQAAPQSRAAPKPAPAKKAAPEPNTAPEDARELAEAADSLVALKAAVEGFEGCALKKTARNTVFARGSMASGVMIIGEAPGFEEDAKGEPFVGRSGQLLDRMFAAIGLDREDIYVTNMLFWRPPKNRDPSETDIQACLAFVRRHIALAQPSLLVLAGKSAAQTLLGTNEGIMRLRGKWGEYRPAEGEAVPALPMLHPAFLLRKPDFKRQTWRDLLSLRERLDD